MKKLIKKLFKPVSSVGCPKCHSRTFVKVELPNNEFYWKCRTCLYETNITKKR